MYMQDMTFWMRDKTEVEVVDFLIQVKECMVSDLFGMEPLYSKRGHPYTNKVSHCPNV